MASESVAGSIIVIQPGSSHLLVGRATDSTPTIVPHVVAYRRRDGRPPPPPPPLGADASAALAGATRAALAGLARLPAAEAGAPPPQARTDEALAEWSFWDEPAGGGPPFLCGETALRLGPGAPYDLFFPLRRGRFNRAGSAGAGASAGTPSRAYSSQEVVDSLQRLWAHAILDVLEISTTELPSMGVLLLLRDSHSRREASEMISVLFNLGFGALALHVRSACAALGAGLHSAAVVEVEEDTTEVAIVDDGAPSAHGRRCLPCGKRDMERMLAWVLHSEAEQPDALAGMALDGFLPAARAAGACAVPRAQAEPAAAASAPSADGAGAEGAPAHDGADGGSSVASLGPFASELSRALDPASARDSLALSFLVGRRCCLAARSGAQLREAPFALPAPEAGGPPSAPQPSAPARLAGTLGALATHAPPLLLFEPAMREPLLRAEAACAAEGPPGKRARPGGEAEPAGDAYATADPSDYLDEAIAAEMAADSRSHHAAKSKAEAAAAAASSAAPAAEPPSAAFDRDVLLALGGAAEPEPAAMDVGEAIVRAICAQGRPELRHKLYASILLVGSGAGVAGLAPRVREAVRRRLRAAAPEGGGAVAVSVSTPAKADPRFVAWRGATLVAGSEPMHELWIQRGEWHTGGARVLRERLPFAW